VIELERQLAERRRKAQERNDELKLAPRDLKFKIIIIGPMEVGKSCILIQLVQQIFDGMQQSTISCEFGEHVVRVDDKVVELNIWDSAGQESFRALGRTYYRNSQGVLIVYDVSNRTSFEQMESWLAEAQRNAVDNAVILLVGNKTDLNHRRQVSTEEGQQFAKKHHIKFIETSAKTASNIDSAFDLVAKTLVVRWRKKKIDYHGEDNQIKHVTAVNYLRNDKKKKKDCDC